MSYVLISDSTCDLSREKAQQLSVELIPFTFTLEGETYRDNFGQDMDPVTFYNKIRSGLMPTTSLVNTQTLIEYFTPYLREGQDIVYICFSSALSGTCSCAFQAVEILREEFPQQKVYVVDSLCASMGQGLFVCYAAQKRDEGLTAEELVEWLENHKLNLVHWFTVDDITHLFRSGRVKRVAALIGTALKIKPVMHVNNAGELEVFEKVMGRKKAISTLAKYTIQTVQEDHCTIFISHGDCLQEAEQLANLLRAQLNIKELYIHFIGPVIGAHSGPGTLAVYCLGKSR